uniref:Uncharacterized protein n=1 Tax=Rhizophora mucronata TaxID=61149 RepID=A0A2P2QSM9_RHIMU
MMKKMLAVRFASAPFETCSLSVFFISFRTTLLSMIYIYLIICCV